MWSSVKSSANPAIDQSFGVGPQSVDKQSFSNFMA
jgi:hypothetical protein